MVLLLLKGRTLSVLREKPTRITNKLHRGENYQQKEKQGQEEGEIKDYDGGRVSRGKVGPWFREPAKKSTAQVKQSEKEGKWGRDTSELKGMGHTFKDAGKFLANPPRRSSRVNTWERGRKDPQSQPKLCGHSKLMGKRHETGSTCTETKIVLEKGGKNGT